MPYDPARDPFRQFADAPYRYGQRGTPIVPSDATDIEEYCYCMVVATGDIVYIPAENEDTGEDVTVTSAPVGMVLPHLVRRVKATGTTATLVRMLP